MKRLAFPVAIFLAAASAAYWITSSFASLRHPASPEPPLVEKPVRALAQHPSSTPDDPLLIQMKDEFAGHEGPQQEAERLILVAKAARLRTLTRAGDLTPAIIELLGMTDTQAENVQKCMDDARDRMSQELRARLTFSAATAQETEEKAATLQLGESSPERTVSALRHFDIAACPDEGSGIREELHRDLRAAAGELAERVLLDETLLPEMFGKFGQFPIHGTITDYTSEGRPLQMFEFQILDSNGVLYLGCSGSGRRTPQLYLGSTLDDYLNEDEDW